MLHNLPTGVMEALRPAGELVSTLGSFAASAYYARAIGAAAFRPVRAGEDRAVRILRVDDGWALTLAAFLAATTLAAGLVWAFEHLGGYGVSSHAAFTAVLISTLWPYASDRGGQAALVIFLVLVSASRLALEAAMPAHLIGGIATGIACAAAGARMPGARAGGLDLFPLTLVTHARFLSRSLASRCCSRARTDCPGRVVRDDHLAMGEPGH